MTGDSLQSFFADAGPLDAQYRAATETAVLLERSDLVRIAVTGGDREAFLHNMLSQEIKNLETSNGAEAAFLTNKGRLVSNLTVFKEEDRILMELERSRQTPLIDALSRYIISEDVTLTPLGEECSLSIEGPEASERLAAAASIERAHIDALSHLNACVSGRVRVTAKLHEPSPRFDVAGSATRLLEIAGAAREQGAAVGSFELSEIRRIESGHPRFGVDMDESHLPLEAGLDDAVSFDKGCYIGQEYVVRLAHRGHVNKKLVGIRIDGRDAPEARARVVADGREAGTLTSAAYSPGIGAIVSLGYLKREFFEADTRVSVGARDGVVTALPFLPSRRLPS